MRSYASVVIGCTDCGRRASGKCVWRYNALDSLEFRQADPIEFGELIASRRLNAEEGSRNILTHTGWELEPFSWRAQGRNQSTLCHFLQAYSRSMGCGSAARGRNLSSRDISHGYENEWRAHGKCFTSNRLWWHIIIGWKPRTKPPIFIISFYY